MTLVEWLGTGFLAAAIWAARFLVPKAKRESDLFALICAVLTLVIALLGWLVMGAGVG